MPRVTTHRITDVIDNYGSCATCGPVKVWKADSRGNYTCSIYGSQREKKYTRAKELQKRYGITIEQYNEMLAKQNGVCAICKQPEVLLAPNGEPRNLCVDHDHSCCTSQRTCGKCIRGLLCQRCNVALGYLENYGFHNFQGYLEQHSK